MVVTIRSVLNLDPRYGWHVSPWPESILVAVVVIGKPPYCHAIHLYSRGLHEHKKAREMLEQTPATRS